MIRKTKIYAIMIVAIGMAFLSIPAFAQDQANENNGERDHRHHLAWMEEMHQQMMEEMKAEDAQLDKLVSEMNGATGQKKVDAIAAVVNQLVQERKMMHQKMEQMRDKMEEHHRKMMEEKQRKNPGPSTSPAPGATSSPARN